MTATAVEQRECLICFESTSIICPRCQLPVCHKCLVGEICYVCYLSKGCDPHGEMYEAALIACRAEIRKKQISNRRRRKH